MDISALRTLLRPIIGNFKDSCTNTQIPDFCSELGLPVPEDSGSKRDRWHVAFDSLDDPSIANFAQRLLELRRLSPQDRNDVQDIIWAGKPVVAVPKRYRRDISRVLQRVELFHNWDHFAALIRDIFVVYESVSWASLSGQPTGTLGEIYRHFVRNPEDANVEWLFEHLRVFDLSDKRFSNLIEGLTSADVQVDVEHQVAIVEVMNASLNTCGLELRQTDEIGGYPVFNLVAMYAVHARPKNLIFASPIKPDIRIRDAVNNDIEIVSNADQCLVFDRPVGAEGLRWKDLQNCWSEISDESDQQVAKEALYQRLLSCLPKSSPPQRLLFKSFYSSFGKAVPNLPALLPEVWLHWDPRTVSQRGAYALLNHRMDFLLLLPGGARVVIEVDGVQHYADTSGKADTHRYGRLAAGDRELKLAGYEVYRFGGIELQGSGPSLLVEHFFKSLFLRHGIKSDC